MAFPKMEVVEGRILETAAWSLRCSLSCNIHNCFEERKLTFGKPDTDRRNEKRAGIKEKDAARKCSWVGHMPERSMVKLRHP